MSEQAVTVPLQRDGKLVDPAELLEALLGADGADVTIDAADTPLLTSRHLQVLIAAERRTRETAHSLSVTNRNEQFESCLALLGWQPNS